MRTITMTAGQIGFAIQALQGFDGRQTVMQAWRIGQILNTLRAMQATFIDNIRPFVDADGGLIPEADEAEVQRLCDEEITFEADPLRVQEMDGLTVAHTDEVTLLTELGLMCACPRS